MAKSFQKTWRRLWPWAMAALSGVLLALCYPGWNASELIWVWQMPLLAALWFSEPGKSRWRHGLALGYVAGFAFFFLNLHWLFELRKVGGTVWAGIGAWVALPAYLGVYFALWGAFAATVGRWKPFDPAVDAKTSPGDLFGPSMKVIGAAALNAAAWCGLEWLRGVVFTGFSWNGLGVALHENLLMIQAADLVGVKGLSFVLVFWNVAALATLARIGRELGERRRVRPHLDFAAAVALIIGLFLYGLTRLGQLRDKGETVSLRALLVQLNTPIDEKWDEKYLNKVLDDYRELTRAYVESSHFDLVLWPETALPGRLTYPWVQEYLNEEILRGGDFHLLMGLEEEEFNNAIIYNSIALMRGSTRSAETHRKLHLVPFGEYLPMRDSFPVFAWIAGGMVPRDFTAGTSYEPLKMEKPELEIIPLVCFEDTIGRLARRFVRPESGAQLLVNVTNDGWFYESVQPLQHLANAKFRCVELRRPMARAANTGVSCFIDAFGSLEDPDAAPGTPARERLRRVQDYVTGNTFVSGTLPATLKIAKHPPRTVYARHGDAFSVGAGVLALLAAAAHGWRSRGKRVRGSK